MGKKEVLTRVSKFTLCTSSSHVSCSVVVLVAFLLAFSTGQFDLFPTSTISVWVFHCFKSFDDAIWSSPINQTRPQQLSLCLVTLRKSRNSPRLLQGDLLEQVLSCEDVLSELLCYFTVEPAKSPVRTATPVTSVLVPLGPKPRPAPYFTEAVELLPGANEWWSTVKWPSSELMNLRWTDLFSHSPLMPISSSTFTFNHIWLRGQFVSDFADLGWMQAQKENTCSLACSFWLCRRHKQLMTCWQTYPEDGVYKKTASSYMTGCCFTVLGVMILETALTKDFPQKSRSWLSCFTNLRQWEDLQLPWVSGSLSPLPRNKW